jgi:hypothetical protein
MKENRSLERATPEQLKEHAIEVFLKYADRGEQGGAGVYCAVGDFLGATGTVSEIRLLPDKLNPGKFVLNVNFGDGQTAIDVAKKMVKDGVAIAKVVDYNADKAMQEKLRNFLSKE